jgi:hypothetical protein
MIFTNYANAEWGVRSAELAQVLHPPSSTFHPLGLRLCRATPLRPIWVALECIVTEINALLTDISACVTKFNGLFNARNSKINAL